MAQGTPLGETRLGLFGPYFLEGCSPGAVWVHRQKPQSSASSSPFPAATGLGKWALLVPQLELFLRLCGLKSRLSMERCLPNPKEHHKAVPPRWLSPSPCLQKGLEGSSGSPPVLHSLWSMQSAAPQPACCRLREGGWRGGGQEDIQLCVRSHSGPASLSQAPAGGCEGQRPSPVWPSSPVLGTSDASRSLASLCECAPTA